MEAVDGVYFFQNSIEEIDSIDLIRFKNGFIWTCNFRYSPNLTGINAIDIENIYELNILTLDTAAKYLNKSHGSFIMKTFQNSMLKNLRKKMELSFKIVQTFKPAASKKAIR